MRTHLLLTLLLSCSFNVFFAQWTATSGPTTGYITALATRNGIIFAGTSNTGVYTTANDGTTWVASNTGLPNMYPHAFLVDGDTIYQGSYHGTVYRSSNSGATWTAANTGIPTNAYLEAFAQNGNSLFAGTSRGVYFSGNKGASWSARNTGLLDTNIISMTALNNIVFAGTLNYGIFLSSNNGQTWSSSLYGYQVLALITSGSVIYAGTHLGVYASSNNGLSWQQMGNLSDVRSLATNGSDFFAGTGNGIFYSNNGGSSWTNVSTGLPTGFGSIAVKAVTIDGPNAFLGTGNNGFGVFKRSLSDLATSVIDTEQDDHALFYPNPTTGTFKIELPDETRILLLTVYDLTGKLVYSTANLKDKKDIELGHLSNGVYMTSLQTINGIISKRLIIHK